MDWKKHKTLCKKLQGVHCAPAIPQQSDDAVKPGGGERGGGAAQQQQPVVVAAILLMKRMRLRTHAQYAWTTRMMRLCMVIWQGCVLRAGSRTGVPAKLGALLTGRQTAQPAVHH